MKSIKQKLMVSISALVTVVALICGGIGIFGNYTSAMSMLEQNLTLTAEVTAQLTGDQIDQLFFCVLMHEADPPN